MSKEIESLEQAADMHRDRLGATLKSLAGAVNPERVASSTVGEASTFAHSALDLAMEKAKRNPVGVSLLGLGLAMIALQSTSRQAPKPEEGDPTHLVGQDERIARADARMQARARVETGRFAPEGATGASLRKYLDAGLDKLSPEARDRVTKARLKAIDAQDKVDQYARRASASARDAHRSQPLVTSLAVAGIGALIGALLPSTRAEQDLMGAKRDQLLRDAEATLHAELAALEQRGKSAAQAGVAAAQDALKTSQRG